MGAASRGGSPSAIALGGAGASIEVRHNAALGATVVPGNNTGWTDGGVVRYGGDVTTLPGVNAWANGSGGATPNRGYIHLAGAAWKRARNTVATAVPIDWVSGVCPMPILQRPTVNLNEDLQVWEVAVTLMLDSTPAAAIDRDCGLVCILSSNTTFANSLRAGVAVGNDFAGFGVVFNGTNGELQWIIKKSGAAGGSLLAEQTSIGVYGALRPIPVKLRIHSATLGGEAKVEIFIDGALWGTRLWGPGSLLPTPADATFQATLGYYRPMIRAAQSSASTAALLFREEVVRAARSAALFL